MQTVSPVLLPVSAACQCCLPDGGAGSSSSSSCTSLTLNPTAPYPQNKIIILLPITINFCERRLSEKTSFIMCTFGVTRALQGECTKQPQHKVETRLRRRCLESPKPGSPCEMATRDTSLDQLPSRKGGPCPACRDSGVALEVYRTRWVR